MKLETVLTVALVGVVALLGVVIVVAAASYDSAPVSHSTEPMPTPEPTETPTITPVPATPTPAPTPTPTPVPQPTPSSTPMPNLYEHGWTPATGMDYEQYMKVYNATNGAIAPKYEVRVTVSKLQQVYAIGDQIVAQLDVENLGFPIDGLSCNVKIEKFNPATMQFVELGQQNEYAEALLPKTCHYISREIRWQIPASYMGVDCRGVFNVIVTVRTNAGRIDVWSQRYQIKVGERGADGMVIMT